jgi:hypothetical protein
MMMIIIWGAHVEFAFPLIPKIMARSETFFTKGLLLMMNHSARVVIKLGTDLAFSKSRCSKSRMRAAAAHGHH